MRGQPDSNRLAPALVFLCGLVFGLGLTRDLFERFPTRLTFFGDWPAAIAFSLSIAALVVGAWLATARLLGVDPASLAPAHLPLLFPLIALIAPDVNLLRAGTLLAGGVVGYIILALIVLEMQSPVTGHRSLGFGRWDFGLRVWPVLVALVLSALYLGTLAPTVGEADTFEFQVDIIRLAVAHGSGYPLYMLLGKVFSHLPLPGTVAYRINLSSALFGIAASLGVYALVWRLSREPIDDSASHPGTSLPAVIAALTFGLSFSLWSRAVEAEVYTLNAAFVVSFLWLLISLLRPPTSNLQLPLLALLFGLSLTNHLTTILLIPATLAALGFAVLHQRHVPITHKRLPLATRTVALALVLFALGLSVYLYIPIRWPAVNNGETLSLAQFATILSGREAPGALRLNAWHTDASRYAIVGEKVLAEFGWAGAGLATVGVVWLTRRNWRWVIVLGLAYAAYIFFAISFYVPDPDFSAFLIPAHLIQSVMIGLGVGGVARGAWRVARTVLGLSSSFTHHPSPSLFIVHWPLFIAFAPFFLLPLSFIWQHLPRADKSGEWEKYQLGRYILSQPLAQGAVVLADSEKIAPLYYLQVAEGVRPDLKIVVLPDETAYRAALDEAVAAGKTVYLGRYLPGLQGTFHLRSVGPLTEVGTSPLTTPPEIAHPLDAMFGGSIRLLGANFDTSRIPAGDPFRVNLYWLATRPVESNYLVRLRLTDANGAVVYESPGRVPANNFYPTNAWQNGEIVPDFHEMMLDTALPPGRYALAVGLFPPFGEGGLTLSSGDQWAKVETIDVLPSPKPPNIPRPMRFRYSPDSVGRAMTPPSAQPGSPGLTAFSREISSPGVLVGAMPPGNRIGQEDSSPGVLVGAMPPGNRIGREISSPGVLVGAT
ncbi:MAG: DUF2723 domain-containing protein, partial [Chloroflexi bacterium]|nr:DUF2723 domain-containing protein [Chloroflexota bacterium]